MIKMHTDEKSRTVSIIGSQERVAKMLAKILDGLTKVEFKQDEIILTSQFDDNTITTNLNNIESLLDLKVRVVDGFGKTFGIERVTPSSPMNGVLVRNFRSQNWYGPFNLIDVDKTAIVPFQTEGGPFREAIIFNVIESK